MALKILKSSEPLIVEHIVTTIYAPPGIGKTSLGFTADAPLLLDFDQGAYRSANRGDSVQLKSWAEVASITADDLKGYKTLILDTAGRGLDHLSRHIIAENPKMGRGGGALSLQGFGELKTRFSAYVNLIKSFGLDLVLIAHAEEQKSGDDIIERLDVQGGSKQEIYKSADMMGRLKIKGGKRTLNFDPTETSFGKNPAGFPEFIVPNFSAEPHFLAGIITQAKAAINRQSEASQAVAQELADWQAKFQEATTLEALNGFIAETAKASDAAKDNVKRLLVKVGKQKGFTFDTKAKEFRAAA